MRSFKVDPLSEVLALLKLRSYVAGGFDLGGDWAIAFGQHEGLKFHAVVSGGYWLVVDGLDDPVRVEAGDCFVLTQGRSFRLCSDPGVAPVDVAVFAETAQVGQIVTLNGGGCRSIGGYCSLDGEQADLLLGALPPLILVRDERPRETLRWCVERLQAELTSPQPGSFLFAQQLATMVLVEAIRIHLADRQAAGVSWLGALGHRQMRIAIDAMHRAPAQRWTLKTLADEVGMSRTGFAVTFKKVTGVAPIDYLTRWRMSLAADRLTNASDSIADIALDLGYESEKAFTIAFKRVMASPPRRYGRLRQNSQALS